MSVIMMKAMFSRSQERVNVRCYPYLGQLAFQGVLDEITGACKVPSIRSYNPACVSAELKQQFDAGLDDGSIKEVLETATWAERWFNPEDAWKTVYGIEKMLQNNGAAEVLKQLDGIRDEVAGECHDLRVHLEMAYDRGLQFKIEIEEMDNPPRALVDWTDRYMEMNCGEILALLEEAGIIAQE